MKRLISIGVIFMASALGCASDDETESMTGRSLELADSVDALVDSLSHHMSGVLVVESWTDLLAEEKAHFEKGEVHLDVIAYWVRQLEDCVNVLDGEPFDTSELKALWNDARLNLIGHRLRVLWDDNIENEMNGAELDYQIEMNSLMGEMRAQPIYDDDFAELYNCPLFEY